MITVEEVKVAIRVTSSKLDDEVQSTIDAAVLDLGTAGVQAVDDALIGQAIKQYARWQFDYMGKADQYQKAYVDLKSALSLIPEYNGGVKP
ncbi:hypothetical protein INF37_04630 [Pseudoflavonifractor sp. DSM 107456]|uniref:DNA-packaging protein n=1 Tax=Pseudoflavonifractor gallinarum TaxID=2779352 RepID=A0ABR9RAE7_9FIRM|nr:hypothetical protein [Pseudoflavonifractor gallinarum]MBE5055283.1 hypothetical protein [Pseudoflavonifractor gallinarum]